MPIQNPSPWSDSLPTALLLMAPFDLLASLAMDVYLPVVPMMPSALGTSPAVIQLTLSLYMALLGAGQIIFGPLSDRMGRRPVLLGGAILFSAASFLLAITSTGPMFVALRVLQGLGASAALVATFATVRDVYSDRPESTVIYSLFSSMLAFVPALGPIIGALIAVTLGWQAIFVTLGILALIALTHALLRWHETRPVNIATPAFAFGPILRNFDFWTYTLGFSTAMGAFFVFFSTSSRVLIENAGLSQIAFSVAFGSVAVVMIVTTRFAKSFVARWDISGSAVRDIATILAGAAFLAVGQLTGTSAWLAFLAPTWLIAVGIVFTVSVTTNGALQRFGNTAGTAVALYYCIQSLIVGVVGTMAVVLLPGNTAWPLITYCGLMGLITLLALTLLNRCWKNNPMRSNIS